MMYTSSLRSLAFALGVSQALAVQIFPNGYGRQPCVLSDDLELTCVGGTMSCAPDQPTAVSYCGVEGAYCDLSQGIGCDGGRCINHACYGGFGQVQLSDGGGCLGNLKPDNGDGYCGGEGASCAVGPTTYSDSFCEPGLYCSPANGYVCTYPRTEHGADCMEDPTGSICGYGMVGSGPFAVTEQMYPKTTTDPATGAITSCTCAFKSELVSSPGASARARVRRRLGHPCPAGFAACPLDNGFECVDTQSNIEQCGGCAHGPNRGTDCSSLPGVAAVGCVGGQCRAWACEAGYRLRLGRCVQ